MIRPEEDGRLARPARPAATGSGKLIAAQSNVQLGARDAESGGSLGLVTGAVCERLRDHVALDGAQVGCRCVDRRQRTAPRSVQRQVFRRDQAAFTENRGPLERIAQLPHVSRPVVVHERLLGVACQTRRGPPERPADLFEKRFAEAVCRTDRRRRDVLESRPPEVQLL